MCLSTADINNKKDAKKYCEENCKKVKYNGQNWYVGWKCVDKSDDYGKINLYYGSVNVDKVAHSTNKYTIDGTIISSNYVDYAVGFHIFRIRKGARNYSVLQKKVKVLFQNPIVVGTQYYNDVIVATKMIILDKIKV
jgi:hypothetical protein